MPIVYSPARTATVVVAASDAAAWVKAHADYVCDGTADNVEIQAAINALPAIGGSVSLSEGNFSISVPIQLRGTLKIEGQGIDNTILMLASNANCNMFEYTGAGIAYFTEICGMTLNGNNANNASGNGIHTGGAAGAINDGYFHRLFTRNFKGNGIYIYNSWGMVVEDVVSENNDGAGLYVSTAGSGLIVKSCKIISNTSHGIVLESCIANISGCRLAGGAGCYGIYSSGNGTAHNSIINGNYFLGNGIYCCSNECVISNNNFSALGATYSIYFVSGFDYDNVIEGNYIYSGATGICLDKGNDFIISGNRIMASATPININNAAVIHCQVIGNNWEGCTNNPSYAAATTPMFTDNIDINGARWLVDDNEVVLKVSVAHGNQNPAIATIPADSFVTVEVWVNEAFNSDGTDLVTVGYDADPDSIMTSLDVSSTGRKTVTYGVEGGYMGTARAIEIYYTAGGSAPTTGHAVVVLRITRSPTP